MIDALALGRVEVDLLGQVMDRPEKLKVKPKCRRQRQRQRQLQLQC